MAARPPNYLQRDDPLHPFLRIAISIAFSEGDFSTRLLKKVIISIRGTCGGCRDRHGHPRRQMSMDVTSLVSRPSNERAT